MVVVENPSAIVFPLFMLPCVYMCEGISNQFVCQFVCSVKVT